MNNKILALASASLLAIVVPASANAQKPVYGNWGYDPAAMDKSVKPGDDFWAYVNGTWDKNTPIAPDRASAGPFVTLSDQSEKDVREIVDGLANDPEPDHLGQQVGDFYGSYMDQAAIEAAGTAPLKPYLAKIAAAKIARPAPDACSSKPGYASPVDVEIIPDFKNRTSIRRSPARRRWVCRAANIICRRRQDDGASRSLSQLHRDDREACRAARRRSRSGPHHRARDGSVQGAMAGRRPPRHRQNLQPDDRASCEAGAAVRVECDARQGRPRKRQDRSS